LRDDRQLKFAAELSPRARHHLEVRASSISRHSAVLWLDPMGGINRSYHAAFAKVALAGPVRRHTPRQQNLQLVDDRSLDGSSRDESLSNTATAGSARARPAGGTDAPPGSKRFSLGRAAVLAWPPVPFRGMSPNG
jgi:hypothetical protein